MKTCYETVIAGFKIKLTQLGRDKFLVTYGQMRSNVLDYSEAASELGASIMHALACEGKVDNTTDREYREAVVAADVYMQGQG